MSCSKYDTGDMLLKRSTSPFAWRVTWSHLAPWGPTTQYSNDPPMLLHICMTPRQKGTPTMTHASSGLTTQGKSGWMTHWWKKMMTGYVWRCITTAALSSPCQDFVVQLVQWSCLWVNGSEWELWGFKGDTNGETQCSMVEQRKGSWIWQDVNKDKTEDLLLLLS